jgi:hypothetical protein
VPDVPGVKHRYLEVERIRFHVAEAGDGEPLVMLHGWPQKPIARGLRVGFSQEFWQTSHDGRLENTCDTRRCAW